MATLTTPIDPLLVKQITSGKDKVELSRVDYEPGSLIHKRARALYKLGSGGRAHQYAALWSPHDDVSGLDKGWELAAPYATRHHLINLLLKEQTRAHHDLNNYQELYDRIGNFLTTIRGEIKKTQPFHDNEETRRLTGIPHLRKLAFKFLPKDRIAGEPESEAEFVKEYSILQNLRHQNIPGFVEAVRSPTGIGYFADLVDGRTIEEIIDESEDWWRKPANGPARTHLPPEVVLAITTQFYDTLAYLHKRKIYYPDIQQGNIMLGFDGLVNLIDFGFADEITPGKTTLESGGANEDFMPREIIMHLQEKGGNSKKYGHEILPGHDIPLHTGSNIGSTATLTYLLMCNAYPFTGDTFPRLRDAIMNKTPTDPRQLNSDYSKDEVEEIYTKPARKEVEKRPTAPEMAYVSRSLLEKRLAKKGMQKKSPEQVLQEFMLPPFEQRALTYASPELNIPPRPIQTASRKKSTPFRKTQAPTLTS
ncbi:MAG TPA: protein kinase [Candidatus Nanoarchaeia archaeon]|nr:protein kinase [Candidatus Nanoarchaeia archaeon]